MINLLSKIESYANEHHKGYFTVLKSITCWHACYGVLEEKDDIDLIHRGETLEEVLHKLIDDPIDALGVRAD